jgi:diacylglycerol O-acyltransferase / wax synthase
MHVGGVLVFDGPVRHETVVQRIVKRLFLIPRYRMRLEEASFGLANPVWVEDARFEAERHVKRVALPTPGEDRELSEFVGRVMSEPLDRSRPLWQLFVVESLAGSRTALVVKMHHALVDGIAAVDVSTAILDPTPEELELSPPEDSFKSRQSATVGQLAQLREAWLGTPRQLAKEAIGMALTLDPRHAARQVRGAVEVLAELAKLRPSAPETRLNVLIGRDRRFVMVRARLEDVKMVRRAANATVNDVLLASVSLMLSDYLGEPGPDAAVALVPVSIRAESEKGDLGNRISTVFVDLPLRGDPLERVRAISASMRKVRRSAQVRAGALIVGATGLAPPIVSSLAVRAMSGPRLFNLVVSNVPGPQQTFYLAGVPLLEAFPAVPLNPRNQALSVGILSYDGGIYCGLLADRDALPDVDEAAVGLERALTSLLAASDV